MGPNLFLVEFSFKNNIMVIGVFTPYFTEREANLKL